MGWLMISPMFIGGFYNWQVNGISYRSEFKIGSLTD